MIAPPVLRTSIGEFTLHEYRVQLGDHSWSFLHTGTVVTLAQEQDYLLREQNRLPYGAMLWPSSIALAHDLYSRATQLPHKRVLELGAGTGIPGIVAATLGAYVLQIDRNEVALHVCAQNVQRNATPRVQVRAADWQTFHAEHPFDLILGADVLYAPRMHDPLRAICDAYLAPGGTVLFADPLRVDGLSMLEGMAHAGYRVSFARWSIGVESGTRTIGIYEAVREAG